MDIKKIHWLTYASLMSLALGLFTSITFSALHHIFILIPCLYFLNKTDYKSWPKSAWALLALIIAIILSVLVNQDIAVEGYAPLTRVKYYLFGLLGIAPISAYFRGLSEEERVKRVSWLLYALIGVTTLASLSGMSAVFFGYNFLKLKAGFVDRNGGLAGMLMNYAHNMAFFEVFLTGLLLYRNEIKKYLNVNFLYAAWAINLLGLYTTYTRGALLAFLVALPFFFIRKHIKAFVICFIGLCIIGVGAYKIAGKSVIRPDSDKERLSQWVAAYHGFKERPVLGLGYMNFEKVCTRIKKDYNVDQPGFCGHAHSNYFEMLASTGLIGFILFLCWQVTWLVEVFKRNDLIARLGLPLILVFIVGGQTQATFTLGANLFLIMPLYFLTQIKPCLPRV
jgi:O-antigen ligase